MLTELTELTDLTELTNLGELTELTKLRIYWDHLETHWDCLVEVCFTWNCLKHSNPKSGIGLDGLDWIYLRTLLLLEHLAVLITTNTETAMLSRVPKKRRKKV